MGEFVPYQDKVNFNVLHYPPFAQVSEAFPQEGQPERQVAICRCWQSKKFPYCDNSHKPMVLNGDNVGPYVAVLRTRTQGKQLTQQQQQQQQQHQQQQQRVGPQASLFKRARLGRAVPLLAVEAAGAATAGAVWGCCICCVAAAAAAAGVVVGGFGGFMISEFALRAIKRGAAAKEAITEVTRPLSGQSLNCRPPAN
ncbi:hypothetical protein Efla_004662 [Eimeria flavescens]